MYHLKNKVGNIRKITDSATKRDALLAKGYKEIPEPVPAPAKKPSKTREKVAE